MVLKQHLKIVNLLPEAVNECMAFLKEVLKQKYFEFNRMFYDQQG